MKANEISLTIETSGLIGSVALGRGKELLEETSFSGPLRHGAETLPTIDRLFKDHGVKPAELEVLYVSAGPGSFTGIRLAVTMAKTIAYANNARIIAVPSLDAQVLNARQARQDGYNIENIAVVLEAGRGKVFAATYKYAPGCHLNAENQCYIPDYIEIVKPDMITVDQLLKVSPRPLHITGEGLNYHAEEFTGKEVHLLGREYHKTRANFVFSCGILRRETELFTDFESFTPLYMRKPEAELNLMEGK
ncbi:MAG: tRNA (adenosine(37)-N6)-threonylcarbamoyltransferase complex dimerization subunit type 1 TsaB [Sedimentisphaerales bacterium]|nr:tRNA (adenosine(37)-N6)-threonylcarbamoyltransferase complex dimerization subunit type 1 TsaB [Sedimentisphaerales bacterium]MBN2843168.1 tRNA (adenosine(37)-N6)-threonylcarbamoyltransferase complex dimerization subunit type 1 TsaB [Sedimentisphaerales bacterium]